MSQVNSELHKLQRTWVMWYDKPEKSQTSESYENALEKIGEFNTVEDFWSYFNNIPQPTKIELNANFHLFTHGVKPMWEDPANANGGRLIITLNRDAQRHFDHFWENLSLACVGETLDADLQLCGIVASRRDRGDRLAIWVADRSNDAAIDRFAARTRALIAEGVNVNKSSIKIHFSSHDNKVKRDL